MIRIAVVWGNHRNDAPYTTHHGFWETAIRAGPGLSMERFTWGEIGSIPEGFSLYLFVDFHPCLFKLPPDRLRPRALFWWDSFHFTFAYTGQVAEMFDRAYYAERMTAETLRTNGFTNVSWMPSGFHPGLYRPLPDRRKVHDYAFVGQQDDVVVRAGLTRRGFLERLARAPGLHGYIGRGVYGEVLNGVYNDSKALFDWTIFNNLGTRFFEAVGSGGFLLMNRGKGDNGMDRMGIDGTHFVSYDGSWDDFESKLRRYLADDALRTSVAERGHAHFLANHTYARRLDVILGDFGLKNAPSPDWRNP